MSRLLYLAPLLLCLLPSCSGGGGTDWGEEMSLPTQQGKATMYHTAAVNLQTAGSVLSSMVEANYNFASNLPEQVDRVDGKLTLRLCNDNRETIGEIKVEGVEHGAVSYFQGLAHHVSKAVGGEEVIIILCEETLDTPFYTVDWLPIDG
ncbi:MAG: hypothetical protein ACPG31_09710 [Planctomycetota bacterium]